MEELKDLIGGMLAAKFNQHTASLQNVNTQYDCPICRDSGWVEADPETRAVRRCDCMKAKEAEAQMRNSGLAEVMDKYTFDTFRTDTPVQVRMKELALRYIDDLYNVKDYPEHPWLYIGGNPGSGKTHICSAVCVELLKRRVAVKYAHWLGMARELKASVNDEDFDDLISGYVNAQVLYIDDLLKQRYVREPSFTDADIKVAFRILDERYHRNKPTIITTEWDLINQLLTADEGVFSRVYGRSKAHMMHVERKPENNFRLTA